MSRFIARFQGNGPRSARDVARIGALPDTTILDETSARMVLVDAPEVGLRQLLASMPGWTLVPERTVPLPDTRVHVVQPPGVGNRP